MKRRRCWSLAAMDPLVVVEEQLGSIETWPTSVITDMFTEEPTAGLSRRVAEFMYDNCVSVSDAVRCYRAVNNEWRAVAKAHTYSWYFQWDQGDLINFQNTFNYNTKKKWVMWIGTDVRVISQVAVIDFGPARAQWPGMISLTIEQVRMDGRESVNATQSA